MIPVWKLRREIGRFVTQIAALPALIYEPFQQKRQDAERESQTRLHEGAVPVGPKVCVFLVYQPGALPQSILLTCKWLRDRGYATLLVANGGLAPEALEAVTECVWKVMERPNYGYDFGGYRQGLLHVAAIGLKPERLVILNDSIWLPLELVRWSFFD